MPRCRPVSVAGRRAAGRRPAPQPLAARRPDALLRLRPRAAARPGGRAARGAAARHRAALRDEGQPDAGAGAGTWPAWSTASTSPPPASCKVALDAGADPHESASPAPASATPSCARRWPPACWSTWSPSASSRRCWPRPQALGVPARVAVRVNPDFELKGSGMKMGGGPKQFGVDVEQVPELLAEIGRAGLQFEGFHLFAGSQNLRAESICEAQQQELRSGPAAGRARALAGAHLNLGGGFGIPYFPGEQRLDLAPIGDNLRRCRRAAQQAELPAGADRDRAGPLPGRRGRAVRDAGRRPQGLARAPIPGHRRRPAPPPVGLGNFGQVVRKNYPVTIGNRMGAPREPVTAVVGPLCTPLDLLADRMALPRRPRSATWWCVFQSGAYGASASPQAFLGHPSAPAPGPSWSAAPCRSPTRMWIWWATTPARTRRWPRSRPGASCLPTPR
jgi:diaminopimelate decarboxylase